MSSPRPTIAVLLVEDNRADERFLCELLSESSEPAYTVHSVQRLADAVAALQNRQDIDVVLLDLSLPDSQGLQTFVKLHTASNVPIVVLTGSADEAQALKAVQLGAQDYIYKGELNPTLITRSLNYAIERKRAAEKLRFQGLLLEAATEAVMATDVDGAIVYWNRAAEMLYGRTSASAIGYDLVPLTVSPIDAAKAESMLRAALHGQRWTGDLLGTSGAGSFIARVSAAPVYDNAGTTIGVICVARDVTGLRHAEKQLRRFAALVEATPDLVALCSPQGEFEYINAGGRKLLGLNPVDDIRDMTIEGIHAASARNFISTQSLPAAIEAGVWSGETRLRPCEGRDIPVWETLLTHRSSNGEVEFLSLMARDLTPTQVLEDQLRQAQKMEAVGRLAGGVAHDFNNLLTAMQGYLELATEPRLPPEVQADLDQVLEAVHRAQALTRQLLTFSRRNVTSPATLSPNSVVAQLEKLLRRLIGEDVELLISLGEDIGQAHVDPNQLEQVLVNLVVNARDAMPSGGTISIETRKLDVDATLAQLNNISAGRYTEIAVSDTGIGMTPDTISHLFEPFFTTKEAGLGTGLGLSTAYGIVTQSGGTVLVYSEPNAGSTFRVLLPCSEEAQPASPAPATPGVASSGSETILVAEDEAPVRFLIRKVLSRAGYRVLEAANGQEAMELAEHERAIDLLITDVVMPGDGGRDLANKIIARRPQIAVLYISGYTPDILLRRGVLEHVVNFVEKPFSPTHLLMKVREVLDSRTN